MNKELKRAFGNTIQYPVSKLNKLSKLILIFSKDELYVHYLTIVSFERGYTNITHKHTHPNYHSKLSAFLHYQKTCKLFT